MLGYSVGYFYTEYHTANLVTIDICHLSVVFIISLDSYFKRWRIYFNPKIVFVCVCLLPEDGNGKIKKKIGQYVCVSNFQLDVRWLQIISVHVFIVDKIYTINVRVTCYNVSTLHRLSGFYFKNRIFKQVSVSFYFSLRWISHIKLANKLLRIFFPTIDLNILNSLASLSCHRRLITLS